jgi:hypothetical protein
VACGGDDLGGSTALSARRGGLLCRRCRAAEGGQRLSQETVAFLRASVFGEVAGVLADPHPPSAGTVLESRAALGSVLEYHHAGRKTRTSCGGRVPLSLSLSGSLDLGAGGEIYFTALNYQNR